jgi:glycosyltransferase involved in cell wall biosynthesis
MRVLWAAAPCPVPPSDGNRIRHFHLLREVALRHEVTLVCPLDSSAPDGRLQTICTELRTVPASSRGQRSRPAAIRRRLPACIVPASIDELVQAAAPGEFDVAFGALWMTPVLTAARARRTVVDDQNFEREKYARLFRHERLGRRKLARLLDVVEVGRFERAALAGADAITVCSARDAALLARIDGGRPSHVVPNGVDLDAIGFHPGPRDPDTVVFVGSLAYEPNADAVRLLTRDVLPRIWRDRPQVRALIVGRSDGEIDRSLRDPRIEVTGEAPSPLPYLHRAALTVLPLRSGGGTRLKVLEAMAAGTPVVSTAVGVEGLELVAGAEAWVAERPADLAEGVLALLADPGRADAIARAARARVERDFGWAAIGSRLCDVLEQ